MLAPVDCRIIMYSPRQTPCQMAWLAITLRREIYRHAPVLPDNNQVIGLYYIYLKF